MIRHAHADDLPALQEIERAAGAPFRRIGMGAIADDEPPTLEDLLVFQRAGRAWVSTDSLDLPVGYLIADVVDDTGHIEQVSVHPAHARRGLGHSLIEAAAAWARDLGLPALTLTTFTDVPWNAPYYVRLGFEVLAPEQLTDGLRSIREAEAARGLDAWPRVAMWRDLSNDGA